MKRALTRRTLTRPAVAAALVAALVLTELAVGATAAVPTVTAVPPGPLALPAAPIADPDPGDEAPDAPDASDASDASAAPESADDADDPGSSDPSPSASSPSPAPSPDPAAVTPPKAPLTVTIDFDDGTADQYQTAALLESRGLRGVYYINSGRIGLTSSYLTIAQIKQLQADGNEVGGHTVFHLHLPQQSIAEQQRQICTDRDQLLALGLHITDLAFPFGEYTPSTQNVARQCGYDSVRTSEGDSGGTDTLPPANPFQLKALSSLGSTTTAQYITDAVTKAEKSGGLMQVVFHRICTVGPCRTNAIRIGVFTDVLNWLAAQRAAGAIQVKTVAQAVGGPLHPPVAAPRPTATLTVPNPSFETAGPVADVPSCWEHTVSGDGNVAAWSLVHGAHSGNWAEHLAAPTITSGVGLVVAQDEGSCAAPTTVGDRYTYSVWYRSSAPIQLVSYRRLAAGGYLSFGLSQPFPASPNQWSYATVATRPMPAGTTGISIGVTVKTAGDFTFDDFAIVDSGPPPAVSAAAAATDLSTPSAAPLAIPMAPAAAVGPIVATARPASRASWVALAALLLLATLALAFVDRRLARRRRRTRG